MVIMQGEGVSKGVAGGKLVLYTRHAKPFEETKAANSKDEFARFEAAREKAIAQLGEIYEKTKETLGEDNAALFEIHQMMLEDGDYNDAISDLILKEGLTADYSVYKTGLDFSAMFSEMDDEYMKARAADVKDISERVVRILNGEEDQSLAGDEPVILAADDLQPSETARLDKNQVLAFVTAGGSNNSHTAIFARTLGIPAIVGVEDIIDPEYEGKQVFVDGDTGRVVVEPDKETAAELQTKIHEIGKHKQYLESFRGKPTQTKDGRKITLCANIGSPADLALVKEGDAEGIGLFRSEFLYLESTDYPTEEAQFKAYKEVAEALEGKQVVIRTLDIGADKQADYFQLPKEENPAMGMRAIRICLTRPEVFKTQLRALYRASAFGNVHIMFPMITSVSEILKIKEICAEVRQELTEKGVSFNADTPLGIMIETPAAAVISDELAKHVDFFSVGTNDLTQYTLAIDRQNASMAPFLDTHHPALLRLLKTAADSAHANGIWIGICGELGADETLTQTYLDMGIDELSVTPASILGLRAKVASL